MTQEFVTLPREVVEQALDALFMYKPMVTGVTFQHGLEAAQALRAALEQPTVQSGGIQPNWKLVPVEPTRGMLDAARKDLVRDAEIDPMLKGIHSAMLAAAPQPQAVEQTQDDQEPVAWIWTEWSSRNVTFDGPPAVPSVRDELTKPVWTPLYTHPQPEREPLTHYEIHELFRRSWDDCQDGDEIKAFARAIEAAHNIK